jgi:predicted nucleic acid-binding protein
MIVVADSSPLHYLILIEQSDVLQRLYTEVAIPKGVVAELVRPSSPFEVRNWLAQPPPWLRVETVTSEVVATVLKTLDLGEREAIALAETMKADLLLIDESAGRAEARRRHLRVTGTLGVLRTAAEFGLVDVPDVLSRLRMTNFYVDEALLRAVFGHWLE